MRPGRAAAAAPVVVAALLLASCGGPAAEPEGLSPQVSPAVEPTATPEPTPDETGLEDLELPPGFAVDSTSADTGGPEAAPLRAYVLFQAAYWRALIENEVPAALRAFASQGVFDRIEAHVADQVDNGFQLAGEVTLTPSVESATDNSAVVTSCTDQGDAFVVRDDGTEEVPASLRDTATFRTTAELSNAGSGWQVTSFDIEVEAC